jgi:hypothetical protein
MKEDEFRNADVARHSSGINNSQQPLSSTSGGGSAAFEKHRKATDEMN